MPQPPPRTLPARGFARTLERWEPATAGEWADGTIQRSDRKTTNPQRDPTPGLVRGSVPSLPRA